MEALELAYSMSLLMMDRIPEPFCVIHLHNMLVQKGYITREIGLYATLQELYQDTFFAEGRIPTSNFSRALNEVVGESSSRRAIFRRRAISRTAAMTNLDIHGYLNGNMNTYFKTKSMLGLYREAKWVPERVPDKEIPIPSTMAMLRIGQTKHKIDPVSGDRVMEGTVVVRRAKARGMSKHEMMYMAATLSNRNKD